MGKCESSNFSFPRLFWLFRAPCNSILKKTWNWKAICLWIDDMHSNQSIKIPIAFFFSEMENIVLKFEYSEITLFHRYKQQSIQKYLVTIATRKIEFLGINY